MNFLLIEPQKLLTHTIRLHEWNQSCHKTRVSDHFTEKDDLVIYKTVSGCIMSERRRPYRLQTFCLPLWVIRTWIVNVQKVTHEIDLEYGIFGSLFRSGKTK